MLGQPHGTGFRKAGPRGARAAAMLLSAALAGGTLWAPALSADAPRPPQVDLRRAFDSFKKLPPDTQERIRNMDRELHEEDPVTRERLMRVMERYVEWLETLTASERAYLEQAAAPEEKARRVRELREMQWIKTLPEADRKRIELASQAERPAVISEIKERDRQLRLEWDRAVTQAAQNQERVQSEIQRWQKEVRAKLTGLNKKEELARLTEAGKKGRPILLIHLAELSELYGVEIPPLLQHSPQVYPPIRFDRLHDFMTTQLTPAEREQFDKRLQDPTHSQQAYADLLKLYWQRHPAELKRLREEMREGKPRVNPNKPLRP